MTLADDALGRRTLRDVLHAALDLPVGERRQFVEARLPAGTVLADALSLLAAGDEVDDFLEAPYAGAPGVFRPSLPARIGSYTIERLLGYGSMGVVYLARQADPARMVALKLLRFDQASAACIDRFRREVAVLARLSHPSIARVHAAGVAEMGAGEQPWFAMEYVDGAPLMEHAHGAALDRRARVALVIDIARAVQHAHEHGIVHRDLKPENVLVRGADSGRKGSSGSNGEDARGQVCVLDFGVAQLATDGDTFTTLTATGQVVGTLAYMAPEQARGGAVDARVDQFALGVMLYELLTGELPLAVRGKLVHEALRIVADGQWTPPSQRDATLAGDLEAILGTALAPEANRRYPSVGAFADDLERWLEGRPVVARTPRFLEDLARLVRRHPLATIGGALATAVLAVLLAFMWQARVEQRHSRDLALLFSDRSRYERLVAEADRLWPADSARVPLLDAWLADARGIVARVERHRATLARLATQGLGTSWGSGGALDSESLGRQGAEYLQPLEVLEVGLLAELRARRECAARLYEETVTKHAAAWADAAERVRRAARFRGFALAPQEGLVPLGPDPRSGLEEFAAFATGALPVRDPITGLVRRCVGDALTFVLVPGGERWIGDERARSVETSAVPEWQRSSLHAWGPPCPVRLDPFLISKFELSQDQCLRLFGFNPSYNVIGRNMFEELETTPLHPVESITWDRLMEFLPRFGMTLPTEAQWEVAARGDSPFLFVWGPAYMALAGRANVNTFNGPSRVAVPPFPEDPYQDHSPIGTFEPSPFGLYDVIANVWEYCLDDYRIHYHELEHRPGDGLVLGGVPDGEKSRRGGDNNLDPTLLTVFARSERPQHAADGVSGVRPAWPMAPSIGPIGR